MTLPSRLKLAAAVLGTLLLPPATQAGSFNADSLRQIGASAETDVIVILRDQVAGVPAASGHHAERRAALRQSQAPVVTELGRLKATRVRGFDTVNAIATRLDKAAIAQLAAHPAVKAVVPDLPLRLPARRTLANWRQEQQASGGTTTAAAPSAAASQLCNTLEPEALQLTATAFPGNEAPQAQALRDGNGKLVSGAGVKVAFIADRLDTTIPGFIRADGSPVFVDYQDFTGDPAGTPTDGAEAFGDASSIAAQDVSNGQVLTYDISQFVAPAHALPSPCNIRVRGVAPGASLVGLPVFSSVGYTSTSNFVQAIEYATVVDHVDVINESFGGNPYPDNDNDPISLANSAAVAAGTTVVVSTGDAGTAGTLGSPSTNADVIAAGASTQFRLYAQTGYGAGALSNGGIVSNNISALSSGGFAQSGTRTVDVVAPGDLGWALCSTDQATYSGCGSITGAPSPILDFGGTSESAPLTSGVAALVIQAYRSTHGGASPTPAQVKQIIMSSATDLGALPSEQGAGLVNAYRAVQLALSLQDRNGRPAPSGQAVALSPNVVEVTALPGSAQSTTVTLTNSGEGTRRFTPVLQALGAPIASGTVTLQLQPGVDPTFPNVAGAAREYVTQTFTVPEGADHLDAAIAWGGVGKIAYLSLLDPSGRQAAYTLPQGAGSNYGHVDVAHPAAGTWTAIVFGRPAGASSVVGPVQLSWAAERFVTAGSVSPASVTLAPGASASLKVSFNMPAQAGDNALAVRFPGDDGHSMLADIPVLARTLVPVGAKGGSFGGTLTGGNGRPGAGPTQTFAFDVPAGLDNLAVGVSLSDPGYALEGILVAPDGMQVSVQANQDPTGATTTTYGALRTSHVRPAPGRWRFVLVQNLLSSSGGAPLFSGSGNQTALPFNATVSLNHSGVAAAALPASRGTRLHVGQPVTVPVQVTNNTGMPQLYFADARLADAVSLNLGTGVCSAAPQAPGYCGYTYLPTQVSQADFLAQGSGPITMDVYNSVGSGVGGTGNPDVFANQVAVDTVDATVKAAEVPAGLWFLSPSDIGPYPAAGAAANSIATAVTVKALPFDSATVADSGDIWADLVNGTSTFNPLVLQPGQSGTLNVTITPTGSVGSTVKGYLFVDTFSNATGTGDELARLPYTYSIVP